MNKNEDNSLWNILNHASQSKPGDSFVEGILAAIEHEPQDISRREATSQGGVLCFVRVHRRLLMGACGLVGICALALSALFSESSSEGVQYADATSLSAQQIEALTVTSEVLDTTVNEDAVLEIAACYSDSLSDEEVQTILTYL